MVYEKATEYAFASLNLGVVARLPSEQVLPNSLAQTSSTNQPR